MRTVGDVLPRVALFAKRDIAKGEELCFKYGPPNPGPSPSESHTGSHDVQCCGVEICQVLQPVSSPLSCADGSEQAALKCLRVEQCTSLGDEGQRAELTSWETASAWQRSTEGLLARHDVEQSPQSRAELVVCEDCGVPPRFGAKLEGALNNKGALRLPRPCLCGTEACLGYLPCAR